MLYLKIINTFLKNNASYSKLSKELKNNIKIQVGQAVLDYWSKQHFICFDVQHGRLQIGLIYVIE